MDQARVAAPFSAIWYDFLVSFLHWASHAPSFGWPCREARFFQFVNLTIIFISAINMFSMYNKGEKK
jgi:hypothetical protein